MDILENLKQNFNSHVSFQEKRPGIMQVLAPLYHEDGDMVDIFLDMPKTPDAPIRITDHGLTLMRLSYCYDVETPAKRRVLDRILSENGVDEENGRFFIDSEPERLYPAILQFAQTIAKVTNMQSFKREIMYNHRGVNDTLNNLARDHPRLGTVVRTTSDKTTFLRRRLDHELEHLVRSFPRFSPILAYRRDDKTNLLFFH
jgi:hypothetical protein